MYYYGARFYDPKLSIWMSVDPLAEKYPAASPYNYCYNNPVRYIDPNGLEPTPYEAALMAADVYGGSLYGLAGGWTRSEDVRATKFNRNEDNGLKGRMYERNKGNGEIEYAYIFAGTDDWADVGNDLSQVVALSSQYDAVKDLSQEISMFSAGFELTFGGHSLGGGLANLASLKTGRSSITFNPAWLSRFNIGKKRKLEKGRSRNNYIHECDPLNLLQDPASYALGLGPYGKSHEVDAGWNPLNHNIIVGHLIGSMIERMRANGQTLQHDGNGSDVLVHRSPRDH